MSNYSKYFELFRSQGDMEPTHKQAQREVLLQKEQECIGRLLLGREPKMDGLYCNRTWDNALCWPPTKAGTLASLPCPDYVIGFNTEKNATRMCMSDGTWFYHPYHNNSWTNFTACKEVSTDNSISVPKIIENNVVEIKLMYNIGYGLSMASLLTAVIIMLYFKKLHCPRNTIHLNLFMSFILRSVMSFVKENLLVEDLGFSGDVYYTSDSKINFKQEGMHWECRLFFTLYNYIIAANYTWIFVEALYLQMLISVAVFSEKSRSKWYILFGWAFPLTFIIPWVCLRTSDIGNEYCWNTYYNAPKLLWVIYGPITASIIVNFIIFINIVRILFTKLNASPCPETKIFRYRRLAKSTLILIPLFGVYYVVFTINTIGVIKGTAMLVMIYAELFFNSFQGFLLSLLFCFFNSEVQTEIKKAWKRHRLQRAGSRSTHYSHSKFTRHRHSDANNGDVKHEEILSSYEVKDSVLSGVNETEKCTDIMNGIVQQSNFQELIEQTPCLDKKQRNERSDNKDIFDDGIVEEHTSCLNNNHTTSYDLDLDNSKEEICKRR